MLDISKLTDNDLNTIERVLENAVVEGSQGRKDEEIIEDIHQGELANN